MKVKLIIFLGLSSFHSMAFAGQQSGGSNAKLRVQIDRMDFREKMREIQSGHETIKIKSLSEELGSAEDLDFKVKSSALRSISVEHENLEYKVSPK